MARRKVPGIREVPVKELRELMKLAWVRDEELSDRTFDMRRLPDGRLLWYLGDHTSGTLYDSREIFAQVKREYDEMGKQTIALLAAPPVDPTLKLLPPIDDFLRDVEAHAKSVGQVLRIPDEALDFTHESLDVVDAALKRVRPVARRMTPEVLPPLVAYVGEVMRRLCDGRWTKYPRTQKKAVAVYDPAELSAWQEMAQVTRIAADKAAADVKARRGSAAAQAEAFQNHLLRITTSHPQPIRHEVVEERLVGHENEPAIRTADGELLQPFPLVFIPMVEPSKRIPLRAAVDVYLLAYRSRQQRSASSPGGEP